MEVTIDIRKHFIRDYLGYIFPKDDSGRYVVTNLHPSGKYICSMVEYSYKPVKIKADLTLKLPAGNSLKSGPNRFAYVSAEAQAKINDYLEAIFELDFERFRLIGSQIGMNKKDVIYAFISSRKLASFSEDIEMLKKREYRQSLRAQQEMYLLLKNKAKYLDRVIREKLKSISISELDRTF